MFKRIISFVLVIAILFCFAVPSAFAATEYYSKSVTYAEALLTSIYNNADDVWGEDSPLPWYGDAIKGITTALNSKICEESHDGYHASLGNLISQEAFGMDDYGRYCLLSCDYCGEWFRCYSSDLIAAHDEYVAGLDSSTAQSVQNYANFNVSSFGRSSVGGVTGSYLDLAIAYPNEMFLLTEALGINDKVLITALTNTYLYGVYFDESGLFCGSLFRNPTGERVPSYFGVYDLSSLIYIESKHAPVYHDNITYYSKFCAESASNIFSKQRYAFNWDSTYYWYGSDFISDFYHKKASSTEWDSYTSVANELCSWSENQDSNTYYYPDTSSVTFSSSNTVIQPTGADATTRTGSLMQTINNYNVDNSVVDNSSNVNYYISPKSYVTELPDDTIDIEQCYSPQSYDEETLVFTEPVTGAQILTSGWTYNYETRTYDIDVPSGTTTDSYGVDIIRIELIYGDEAVTYNYYLADDTLAQSDEYFYVMVSGDENFGTGGSSEEPEEPEEPNEPVDPEEPEEDTHKHSYTTTVTSEPTCESSGIRKYTCNECGDSYTEKISANGHTWTVKQSVATEYDDSGTVIQQGYTIYKCSTCNTEYKDEAGAGPPNSSADSTDGEGIFKKIGQLFGSILSGLLGMVEAVLGGLLDGLVRLADLVGDKLTQVVEIVTGLFDKIPQLFGGFTALLADVFVFIPEDIITIFTFGAAAIVFVGILLLFIKR